jgi:hypothetical protein
MPLNVDEFLRTIEHVRDVRNSLEILFAEELKVLREDT